MDDPALSTCEFFLVYILGKSFLNEGVEYGCLDDEFLELSARVVLKC